MMPACLTECNSGAFGDMRAGDMQHGAARGDMTPPGTEAAAPAVVGIDWPEGGAYGTLQILYEAEKETTFADNDPVETPTHFGALTLALTQASLGLRLTYQLPCDVGPSSACYYADGGDGWVDTAIRSTLAFLHSGSGMACYVVLEPSSASAANSRILETNNALPGIRFSFTSSATDRVALLVTNAAANVASLGSDGTGLENATYAAVLTHGTARSLDAFGTWRGAGPPTTTETNYINAPTSSDPGGALSFASTSAVSNRLTGYIFAIACYNAAHTSTEIDAVWAAIEAETGALPQ
jgi:hypothetical protein